MHRELHFRGPRLSSAGNSLARDIAGWVRQLKCIPEQNTSGVELRIPLGGGISHLRKEADAPADCLSGLSPLGEQGGVVLSTLFASV